MQTTKSKKPRHKTDTQKQLRENKVYVTLVKPNLRIIKGWYQDGLIDTDVARRLNINVKTLAKYRERYEELANACREGKEAPDYDVQNALLKRALGYEYEETKIIGTKDGSQKIEKVKKHIPPDTVACIFWLKNRKRTEWRDRWELEHSVSLDSVLSALPPEVRELVKQKLAESINAAS